MSIGSEIAYRRSKRAKDATGSLVFDAERKRALREEAASETKPAKRAKEKPSN
jgi:hypothetical protein